VAGDKAPKGTILHKPILRMWSFLPPERGETNDMLPMNPEGVEVDVPQGGQMTMPAEPRTRYPE